MSNICIIPARSGSKRVKDKNIKEIGGKPMIAWTIEAAKKSNVFDKILVSTDSKLYAEVAEDYGAEVPFLRDKYNDNHTVVSEATIYAVKQAEEYYQISFSNICQLMANCPIRKSRTIKDFVSYFIENDFDSLISVFKYGFMNPWWALRLDSKGNGENIFKDIKDKRSQDLDTLYCPTGSIWMSKKEPLFNEKSFYTKSVKYREINWTEAIDIDDYEDFALAESFLKK